MGAPFVSVCVPAYGAEAFLEPTLRSLLAQDRPADEIIVSVDPAGDRTEEVARDLLSGRRARIVVQPQRLGWVGNTNAALRLARGDHAMILPHDDLLAPAYLGACLDALAANTHAALAYSDIEVINNGNIASETAETGAVATRAAAIMERHFAAVSWRGVFCRRRARRHLVPSFALGNFAADTLWVARMAVQGEMARVPEPLYRKRVKAASAHSVWYRATPEENDEMWVVHCIEMARAMLSLRPDLALDLRFRAAFRTRLTREHATFAGGYGSPAMLGADWRWRDLARIYRRAVRRARPYSWVAET